MASKWDSLSFIFDILISSLACSLRNTMNFLLTDSWLMIFLINLLLKFYEANIFLMWSRTSLLALFSSARPFLSSHAINIFMIFFTIFFLSLFSPLALEFILVRASCEKILTLFLFLTLLTFYSFPSWSILGSISLTSNLSSILTTLSS